MGIGVAQASAGVSVGVVVAGMGCQRRWFGEALASGIWAPGFPRLGMGCISVPHRASAAVRGCCGPRRSSAP
eukprot:7321090-Alexandrium_andersonii.AAC.1